MATTIDKAFKQFVNNYKKLAANGNVDGNSFIQAVDEFLWDYDTLSTADFDKKYGIK
jgi:hypothetical protein